MRYVIWTVIVLLVVYAVVLRTLPWQTRRRVRHVATVCVCGLGAFLAVIPLVFLLGYLVKDGIHGLNKDFFTQAQKPLSEPGSGMLHAIIGSVIIVGMAAVIGIPIGVLGGVYLSEYGKGKFAKVIRFLADVMTGLPSIIAGILGYQLIVVRAGGFSGLAGAIALSFLMIPVITRVTEESLHLVPKALREASLGLGVGISRTIWHVVLPAARSGILTGIILAVARVGGETAPLLFTTAGQSEITTNPMQAMAALPLSIYLNSSQPYDTSRQLAATGALFLVLWICLINVGVRYIASRSSVKM